MAIINMVMVKSRLVGVGSLEAAAKCTSSERIPNIGSKRAEVLQIDR